MSDTMKMNEFLVAPQQAIALEAPAGMLPARGSSRRRKMLWLAAVLYGIPVVAVLSYAFWVASHLGK